MDTRRMVQVSLILVGLFFWVAGIYAEESPMVEKNLFAPERKPLETKVEEPKPTAPKMAKGSVQLDGVIIRGDTRKAILKVNPGLLKNPKSNTNAFVTLGLNEQIGEYRIEKIEPRGITLESRGTTLEIPLFAAGKAVAQPPSGAQAPGSVTIMSPTAPGQPGQPAPGHVPQRTPPQDQPPTPAQGMATPTAALPNQPQQIAPQQPGNVTRPNTPGPARAFQRPPSVPAPPAVDQPPPDVDDGQDPSQETE
jgi:hypothetical protein